MKLRFAKNSARLRLSKVDIDLLFKNHFVSETVRFGISESECFQYTLRLDDNSKFSFAASDAKVLINMPKDQGLVWCNSEQVGLECLIPISEATSLFILIEKDFQCLTPRPHEDESDNFTNPSKVC